MLSRVIAKNVGDVFFETQCSSNNYVEHKPCFSMPTSRWLWYNRYVGACRMALVYQASYHGAEWQQKSTGKILRFVC